TMTRFFLQRRSTLGPYFWHFHAARDDHRIRKLVVDWLNVVVPVAIVENAHNRRMSASQDLYDSSLGAAISTSRAKFDHNVIAMHGGVHVARRNVDVSFNPVAHGWILRTNKAIAVAMNRKLAANKIAIGSSLRQRVAVASH